MVPVGYVNTVGGLLFVSTAGGMPGLVSDSQVARAFTYPAIRYVDNGLPGADGCRWYLGKCQSAGWRLRD